MRRATPTTSAIDLPMSLPRCRRAPKTLIDQIAEIPGVAAVDARIAKLALLDIPNFREPATGQFISLPEAGKPTLNQLYMRIGRTPEPLSSERGRRQRELRQCAWICARLALLGDLERPQARAGHRRHRAVARVHLRGRTRRHHAGRPPLRHRLDVGKGARQRLRSRRRVLFGQSQAVARCLGTRGDASGSTRCSNAMAGGRRTGARIRRRMRGSTTSSTCSTT